MGTKREKYFAARGKRTISFVVDDAELKRRLAEAAKADGRSVNGWVKHYILPKLAAEIDAMEAKQKKR
jgi:predicted HicB family RNase H-like nuclease